MNEDSNHFAGPLSSASLPMHDTSIVSPTSVIMGSLLAILPWPVLGIVACVELSLLEKPVDAIFMFGSITMLFLLPLAFVGAADWIYGVFIGIAWLMVLLSPLGFGQRCLRPGLQMGLVWE